MSVRHRIGRRFRFLSPALLAAPLLLTSPAVAQETERIVNYDVQIAVESTGSIFVTEVIDYDFGAAERHGIFRTIPVRFRYNDRFDRVHRVEVLSVKGSLNTPDQFEEEREGDELRIRIGDPDRTITGRHTYAIVYRVEGALNGFSDHNELYWNAIGTDWDVPIGNATVRVTTLGITEVACFSGPLKSSLPCASSIVEEPTATFPTLPCPLTRASRWWLASGVVSSPTPVPSSKSDGASLERSRSTDTRWERQAACSSW